MRIAAALAIVAALALAPSIAPAQDFGAAFSGFDTGSDQPIQIESDRLEIHDADKVAIYSGNVHVRQGETVLEAPEMRIFYTRGDAPAGATPGSGVSRIEAGPGVVVRSGERTATSERAVFQMDQDLVTMTGNVIVTQGTNVVRGDRLVVNLKTKKGRIEGGRVQTLITPSTTRPKPQ